VRPITRRFLAGLVLVAVALLALGALPSYLGSGEAYHLTATPTDAEGPAVDATNLSERRYPYLTAALSSPANRSGPYRRGPVGLKESFTHSPFDEVSALAARNPAARLADGEVLVAHEGQRYRVAVRAGPPRSE
jgi:hypothetical protein